MIWVKIIGALAIIVAAGVAILAYNNAIAKAERLEGEKQVLENERNGWIETAARENTARVEAEKAATARERARRQLQEERDAAREKLVEIRRAKPENAQWLDATIPPDIVARLRLDSVETAAPAAGDRVPGTPAARNPGAPISGQPERGPAQPRR